VKSALWTCLARSLHSSERGAGSLWFMPETPQNATTGANQRCSTDSCGCTIHPPLPKAVTVEWQYVTSKSTSRPHSNQHIPVRGSSGPIGELTLPLEIHTPWGRCIIQSLNPDDLEPRLRSFLQYVFSQPNRGPKIRQLLGLKPYRRAWWTQQRRRRQRSLRAHLGIDGCGKAVEAHHFRRELDNRRGYHNQDYQEYQKEMEL